ncbi:hypothetical protein [Pseudomonas alcaligenes]|uniref:hypothetical protein n=1 Tax=Aquipseudomonas alcaligenes TaxID=43263 RepID=UPI00358FC6D3
MRTALIILIAIVSSGCISADYKSGNYWVLEEKNLKLNKKSPTQCMSNKIETNGATSSSSQIIAPYFIPVFYLSEKPSKEIIVTIKNKTCPEFSIKSDREDNLAYTAFSLSSGHCDIHIPQPKRAEKISIQELNSESDCGNVTITLVKKGFFCVRQTQFGGSPSCEKAL